MKSSKRLGDYIEQVIRRNADQKYGLDDVRGCSNTKSMMKTKANMLGRTFEKFLIVQPDEFVFNRRTTRNGEKIGMAFNDTDREYIFTEDYVSFRVKKECLSILNPYYLYLFFCRSEFDRYARYMSTGSATEFFNWEDMCDVPFSCPSIEQQNVVVKAYKSIIDRIALKQQINDNLAEQLIALFMLLVNQIEATDQLSSICDLVSEKATFGDLENQIYVSTENILPNKQGINCFGTTEKSDRVTPFRKGDVLIANIRPYFKKIWQCNQSGACNADVLCFRAIDNKYKYVLKALLYQDSFYDYVMSGAKGTKMPRGDKGHIMKYPIPCIPETLVDEINMAAKEIECIQQNNISEISMLTEMASYMLTTLSSR